MKQVCPCGGGDYENCCRPFHAGMRPAPTPETLMRSRYSAFVLQLWDYLIATHHPDYRRDLNSQILAAGPHPQWLALNIKESSMDGHSGKVHFIAWYKDGNTLDAIEEISDFVLEQGLWFYTKGQHREAALPGRNSPCICGSGKKFKQCCGR
ncbi:YchJ family protein [Shewanella sedimentimangrovi]|uniref:SEC-C domain-containing protein n=1 Tax=Shewanella sedimentimangrovi TaxID=2814293 RepID=A0ABX7R4U5_9GAMM|nr:YchJ family metal-binding protein [Shewanella sedimentimangrovi]QSX38864.1 SEC-C domain-containing protein [Shewanella sedimentimangrovi]